jgi:peptide/nickel transport system substrate-binding protein
MAVVRQPHREGRNKLMRKYSRLTVAIGAVAASVTLLAACSGSSSKKASSSGAGTGSASSSSSSGTSGPSAAVAYNAAFGAVLNPSTKTGGTLNLGATSDCDSWDPGRTYYGWCWNMERLISRGLVGYKSVNGTKFTLAPDMATTMGTHNATFTKWTYTLKPGLKWSNGKAVTPLDVKYGLERLYATDVINGGPSSYFIQGIKHPATYKGPYKSGDLSTIVTTASTITINLAGPNADFPYLLAMTAASPVPYKTEGGPGHVGATYTKMPLATGPYMIKTYVPGKSVNFVKNPYYVQSTDTIRKPLVDAVNLTIDTNPIDLDNKLKAGTLDANASTGASGLTAAFQSYVLTHPDAKKNVDDPATANTEYLPVMQSVITNVNCRKAIFYATNKASILAAEGGPTAGTITGAMTPPGIPGYDKTLNPYPTGNDNTGDLTKAKAALVACGKPNGFATKFAYATPSTKAAQVFAVEKSALARVGIKLTATTADASNYYSTFIGSPKNIVKQGIGMALAGWGADFPTGVGFYQSIANGNSIVDPGNSNYPSLNDPVVNKILNAAPAGKATAADWTTVNSQIMKDAVYLPLYSGNTLLYRNPRMTNVTCDNALAFGNYDFVNIGVTK